MSRFFYPYPVVLTLFDADGAGTGAGGDTGTPVGTQQGSGEAVKVVYGKQESAPAADGTKPDASAKHTAKDSPAAGDDRSAQFKALITGEYKDLYDAEVNRIIGKRFKDTKVLQESLESQRPIIDAMCRRYGIADGDMQALTAAIDDDDAMWEEEAEANGMSVEQYKQVQRLQRENAEMRTQQENFQAQQAANRQMQDWLSQADTMRQNPVFKDFDLSAEITENPEFLSLLKSGITVPHAYSVLHLDQITGTVAQSAAAQAEKAVTDNIRARGARPQENGASNRAGTVIKDDPRKWDAKDLAEVLRRVERGEKIKL
jgi:hypothetical protein